MNFSPIPKVDQGPAECQIERVEGPRHTTYLCSNPATSTWLARPDCPVSVCPACKRWLLWLDSLHLIKKV